MKARWTNSWATININKPRIGKIPIEIEMVDIEVVGTSPVNGAGVNSRMMMPDTITFTIIRGTEASNAMTMLPGSFRGTHPSDINALCLLTSNGGARATILIPSPLMIKRLNCVDTSYTFSNDSSDSPNVYNH